VDRLGKPVLIEFGRLRLPPARRDVFGGDGDGVEAGFRDCERRGGRAQGLETDLLQGVGEEPALELNPVFSRPVELLNKWLTSQSAANQSPLGIPCY
jgi:hypothetical protein